MLTISTGESKILYKLKSHLPDTKPTLIGGFFNCAEQDMQLIKLIALHLLVSMSAAAYALDVGDTGIWYEPGLSGHGLVVTGFGSDDQAGAVLTWYTYTPEGEQVWFFSENLEPGQSAVNIHLPLGSFPAFDHSLGEPVGELTIQKLSADVLRLNFLIFIWDEDCEPRPQAGPSPNFCYGQITLQRLTPQLDID